MKANVIITLNKTIDKYDGLTRNAVAVEAKVRPATVSDLCSNVSKAIKFDTLESIINALNTLTGEKHAIEDVIKIEYTNESDAMR